MSYNHISNIDNINRVLVCITPQSNSRRLIDRAHAEAETVGGELHILHVEKGSNIFSSPDSPKLLQELFSYGSQLSGTVHSLCGENVADTIKSFIKSEKITHVVLGEPPAPNQAPSGQIMEQLRLYMPHIQYVVLGRNE